MLLLRQVEGPSNFGWSLENLRELNVIVVDLNEEEGLED